MNCVIGLDLSSREVRAAIFKDGKASPLPLSRATAAVPAVVGVGRKSEWVFGREAERLLLASPQSAYFDFWRFLGTNYSPESFARLKDYFPFALQRDADDGSLGFASGDPVVLIRGFLGHVKELLEESLGEAVEEVRLVVPSTLGFSQEELFRNTALEAGFSKVQCIRRLQALALQARQLGFCGELLLIVDVEATGFEVALLEFSQENITLLASSGDTFVGNERTIDALCRQMAQSCCNTSGVDLFDAPVDAGDSKMRVSLNRLETALRHAQLHLLRERSQAPLNLPCLFQDAAGKDFNLQASLTLAELEAAEAALGRYVLDVVEEVLEPATLARKNVSVFMPFPLLHLERKFLEWFGPSVNRFTSQAAQSDSAALGAAWSSETCVKMSAHLPASVGFADAEGFFQRIFPRNTALPTPSKRQQLVWRQGPSSTSPLSLPLLSGERRLAVENQPLGCLVFSELTSKINSQNIQIEADFTLNSEGILTATWESTEHQKGHASLDLKSGKAHG